MKKNIKDVSIDATTLEGYYIPHIVNEAREYKSYTNFSLIEYKACWIRIAQIHNLQIASNNADFSGIITLTHPNANKCPTPAIFAVTGLGSNEGAFKAISLIPDSLIVQNIKEYTKVRLIIENGIGYIEIYNSQPKGYSHILHLAISNPINISSVVPQIINSEENITIIKELNLTNDYSKIEITQNSNNMNITNVLNGGGGKKRKTYLLAELLHYTPWEERRAV